MNKTIYVLTREKFPMQEHWVILRFVHHTSPGYDKDPPYSFPAVEYDAYLDKEAWVAAIQDLENPRFGIKESYVAFKASKPATTITVVKVNE